MPIYEYRCTRCGKRIEKIQSFKDEPLRECAACGGALERVISPPAIQFKGSGWYVTDYARKPAAGNGAAKEGKETKEANTGGSSEKSESKSESKPESKKD